MKNGIIIAILCAISFTAQAQDDYNVRYRDIKDYYDHTQYSEQDGDRYVTSIAGLASFLVPGLGQCYCDEWGRGLGIMGASVGFALLGTAETSLMFYEATKSAEYYRKYKTIDTSSNLIFGASFAAALVTLAGATALRLWNIFDAVRVAEVKNMYYQEAGMHPEIALAPVVGVDPGLQPTVGLGLKVSF